jgi:hypothetical protein
VVQPRLDPGELRRFDEASQCYRRARELKPDAARPPGTMPAHAIAGRPQGWPAFEALGTEQMRSQRRQFLQPLWLGDSSLQGKTILLHAEQGFGDTLQFVRYLPLVAAMGARVILEVQPPLQAAVKAPGAAEVISGQQFIRPSFDHCPLMSLPLACQSFSEADIPRALSARRQRRPGCNACRTTAPRPGLGRQLGADPSGRRAHRRSTLAALRALAPLVDWREHPQLEFYSVQVGEAAVAQLQAHPLASHVKIAL